MATTFGDSTKVLSVWKWIAEEAQWAFYSPLLSGQALADYAVNNGYDVLDILEAGDGFWINVKSTFIAKLPFGTTVSAATFQKMTSGWNLIAIGDNKTPRAFNSALSALPPPPGSIPTNVTSLWAWDAPAEKWVFYAPSLDAKGGNFLLDYVNSRNYLHFGTKTLGTGTGFWVNKP